MWRRVGHLSSPSQRLFGEGFSTEVNCKRDESCKGFGHVNTGIKCMNKNAVLWLWQHLYCCIWRGNAQVSQHIQMEVFIFFSALINNWPGLPQERDLFVQWFLCWNRSPMNPQQGEEPLCHIGQWEQKPWIFTSPASPSSLFTASSLFLMLTVGFFIFVRIFSSKTSDHTLNTLSTFTPIQFWYRTIFSWLS